MLTPGHALSSNSIGPFPLGWWFRDQPTKENDLSLEQAVRFHLQHKMSTVSTVLNEIVFVVFVGGLFAFCFL